MTNRHANHGSSLTSKLTVMYATTLQPRLNEDAHQRATVILDQVLADEFALSMATRDYHWTVTGPHFRSLYELFDEQYRQLDQWMERIVESARHLGVTVRTGWRELAGSPRFTPVHGAELNPRTMMTALIALHTGMVERLRENVKTSQEQIGDRTLTDLLNELLEYHETAAWLLSELLQDRELAQA